MRTYKLVIAISTCFSLVFLIYACSKEEDKSSTTTTTSNNTQNTADCNVVLVPDQTSGGCYLELRTPAKCADVDLTNGKIAVFEWSTNGSGCETPWTLYIAGTPCNLQTNENIKEFSLSTNGGSITQKGGIIQFNAQSLDGLTSTNGVYHWTIKSFYGSQPATIAFKVKK